MADFRSRMVEELYELDLRIQKVDEFCDTDRYNRLDPEDKLLLLDQQLMMVQYRRILSARIARAFALDA